MSTQPLPKGFLRKDLVQQRTLLYKKSNDPSTIVNSELVQIDPKNDTRWVWYSKEQVQAWLDEITYHSGDGLRIYFGRKENGENPVDDDHRYCPEPGQLCLIMVATQRGITQDSHKNVILEDLPDFEERRTLTESAILKGINAGGYCPPMTLMEGEDYPI